MHLAVGEEIGGSAREVALEQGQHFSDQGKDGFGNAHGAFQFRGFGGQGATEGSGSRSRSGRGWRGQGFRRWGGVDGFRGRRRRFLNAGRGFNAGHDPYAGLSLARRVFNEALGFGTVVVGVTDLGAQGRCWPGRLELGDDFGHLPGGHNGVSGIGAKGINHGITTLTSTIGEGAGKPNSEKPERNSRMLWSRSDK
jgi:hypothetical protein